MTHLHAAPPPPPPPIILLVEDDLDTRDMYHVALESEGFWVVDAPNASSAIESALDVHPDLIVTDLGLPGAEDGVGFARGLKANPRTSGIPVLAVTGRDPKVIAHSELLFSEVLLKPILPDVLIGRIRQTLAASRDLKRRSADARARVSKLLARSDRTIASSRRIHSHGAERVLVRPCPKCTQMLSWAERRVLSGVTFDYYQACGSGCGLYCYNHSDEAFVALTER